jgi:hypothetical protein
VIVARAFLPAKGVETKVERIRVDLALCVLILVAANLFAQVIPHTDGETLSGKKIVLPDATVGHPAIFIVGFSHAAGESSGRWDKELRKDFSSDSNLRILSVAELQDAPRLVRGMIRHGMRGSVPQNEQDSFVLLYQDEDVWKKLADFSEADDAYILVVDTAGNIRWRTHGKGPGTQAVNALKDEVAKIADVKR